LEVVKVIIFIKRAKVVYFMVTANFFCSFWLIFFGGEGLFRLFFLDEPAWPAGRIASPFCCRQKVLPTVDKLVMTPVQTKFKI